MCHEEGGRVRGHIQESPSPSTLFETGYFCYFALVYLKVADLQVPCDFPVPASCLPVGAGIIDVSHCHTQPYVDAGDLASHACMASILPVEASTQGSDEFNFIILLLLRNGCLSYLF